MIRSDDSIHLAQSIDADHGQSAGREKEDERIVEHDELAQEVAAVPAIDQIIRSYHQIIRSDHQIKSVESNHRIIPEIC